LQGGHVITPMPGATPTKPGSATLPFFGVEPVIVDAEGREIDGPGEGNLVRSPSFNCLILLFFFSA
jgi:acetyl-CoA synthetase